MLWQTLKQLFKFGPTGPAKVRTSPNSQQLEDVKIPKQNGYTQDAESLNDLGNAHQDKGQLEEALAFHIKAISIKPDFAKAHNNLGNAYLGLGRLDKAISCYQQAISLEPDYANAHNNLGIAFFTQGRPDEAITHLEQALVIKPDFSIAHNYLGDIYQELGKFKESINHFKQAVSLEPDSAGMHYNLGIVLQQSKQLEEAVSPYKKALSLNPDYTDGHIRLGTTYIELGLYEEAIICLQQAASLEPEHPEIHYNLGLVYQELGPLETAISCYEKAFSLKPDYFEAHNNLGYILMAQNRMEESITQFKQVLSIKPDFADAYYNLGNVYLILNQLEDAFTQYQHAISIQPDFPEAHNNIGNTLKDCGQLDQAISHYEKALALKPSYAAVHSNLLYSLSYKHDIEPQKLFEAHKQWTQQHAQSLINAVKTHNNNTQADRCLRIGYLSPDFRTHSVAFFIEPILANHNRDKFEVFAYYNSTVDDNMTKRIQTMVDVWHNIIYMSDEEVCKLIKDDGIDILVDLTGHSSNNRMSVFALKPAPIQITYIGYSTTTGLPTMDYRITDNWTDPPGTTEHYHTEELLRLPQVFLCYQPPLEYPEIEDLPAKKSGYITFGSFNNATKINLEVVSVWARCMQSVPESRLILKAKQFNDIKTRQNFLSMFEQYDISHERIEFISWITSLSEHLDIYNRMDIALDTFPYNGTTTTCEALWMGVPVITFSGKIHQARVGGSILTNIGLPQFITDTHDEFVEKTVELALDTVTLSAIRNELRNKMKLAPLTNARQFTQALEDEYHQMWKRWCDNKKS